MTVNASDALRDAKNDQEIVIIPPGSIIRIRSGTKPASAGTARNPDNASDWILTRITLPAAYVDASSGGVLNGAVATLPWTGTGLQDGTATYYEIMNSGETTCLKQGDVPADMTVNPSAIATGQNVEVTSYQVTAGNA